MRKQKIIITTFAVVFLTLILASPTLACTTRNSSTAKIPFTHTIYYIGAVPGETTIKGDIMYITGGTTKAISLDGTLFLTAKIFSRLSIQ